MALALAPLSREPIEPEDLLTLGEKLGTTDDTATMQKVMLRFRDKVRAGNEIRLTFAKPYYCERHLQIDDGFDLAFGPAVGADGEGGLRQRTIDGGITDKSKIRTRCTFRLRRGGRYTFLPGLRISGSKPDTGSWRDGTKEAQHFIDSLSVDGLTACGVIVDHLWGDFCHMAEWNPGDVNRVPCRNHVFTYNQVSRMGRCGLVPNFVHGLRSMHNRWDRIASSVVDVEPGGGNRVNRNLWFQHEFMTNCNSLAYHLQGAAGLENCYILDNIREGAPVSVECIGPNQSEIPAGTYRRFKNIQVLRNAWDRRQSGGHFMRFWHTDTVAVIGNDGPIRYTTADQPSFNACVNVTYDPDDNDIIVAPKRAA